MLLLRMSNKWQKMNTVSQTESRTLLQHHSFKNSITLRPTWTRGVKSRLRKLSSVLEFVSRQRLQPHFSFILFYFFSNLVEIVCSEIAEFFYERSHSITLSFKRNRIGLMSTRKLSLHVHFTPFRGYLTVESLSYYWDSLA